MYLLHSLKEALAAGKSQSDLQMSKVTQGIRKMEMEIQELKENEVKLKSDFNRRKEDVERLVPSTTCRLTYHHHVSKRNI